MYNKNLLTVAPAEVVKNVFNSGEYHFRLILVASVIAILRVVAASALLKMRDTMNE